MIETNLEITKERNPVTPKFQLSLEVKPVFSLGKDHLQTLYFCLGTSTFVLSLIQIPEPRVGEQKEFPSAAVCSGHGGASLLPVPQHSSSENLTRSCMLVHLELFHQIKSSFIVGNTILCTSKNTKVFFQEVTMLCLS